MPSGGEGIRGKFEKIGDYFIINLYNSFQKKI
jgi:hypothetical protein